MRKLQGFFNLLDSVKKNDKNAELLFSFRCMHINHLNNKSYFVIQIALIHLPASQVGQHHQNLKLKLSILKKPLYIDLFLVSKPLINL
ncbi:hypothetical protein D6B99_04470 [Arachidicoccus soli]|uniref:Uncharacterized protein n=1 Tax=Arachidicoccus soli TaxID=2341117 RepID=A0A386HN75_9BACT|nr:hypothetical protein D6B99_04470 [Arachidicoccus soli]